MNKIKYGLKNVYFAKATITENNTATYSNPIRIPGAVRISLGANGENTQFPADDIIFFNTPGAAGYNGDLEIAELPDEFREQILSEVESSNGLLYETDDAPVIPFALMFEFQGDEKATRHVLYNVTCNRPAIESSTKEETVEPQTTSLSMRADAIYIEALSKNIVKARCYQGETAYASFFTAVTLPTAPTNSPTEPEASEPEG